MHEFVYMRVRARACVARACLCAQMLVVNMSQGWAMYCLVLFYHEMHSALRELRPLGKFVAVKVRSNISALASARQHTLFK